MKRKWRLIDVLQFIFSAVHDFLYLGIAALAYWLWRQPPSTRNGYLIVVAIVLLFVVNAVVNYRGHAKLEHRLEKLETLHTRDLKPTDPIADLQTAQTELAYQLKEIAQNQAALTQALKQVVEIDGEDRHG